MYARELLVELATDLVETSDTLAADALDYVNMVRVCPEADDVFR